MMKIRLILVFLRKKMFLFLKKERKNSFNENTNF
jgi:hypothetical protein